MSDPHDPAYGLKAFSIAGRMRLERERLRGMTETERQWRAQWLKDQELHPEEPVEVPELYKSTTNIFRRMYKNPLNAFQKILEPSLGAKKAHFWRHTLGKSLIALYIVWGAYYVYKYHSNDFTRSKSLEVWINRKTMYPDDPDYPNIPEFEDRDFYDQGFYSSPLRVDIEYEPPPPPPPPPPRRREDGTIILCPPPVIEYYEP